MLRVEFVPHHSEHPGTTQFASLVKLPCIRSSNSKRLRLSIKVQDSDEEFDEWFLESIPEKYGLRPRTMWMHPMNTLRPTDGEYVRVCVPYRKHADKFFKYFRMSVATFDYVLNAIHSDIEKHSNRPSILPGERLAVTLRYLATGMSFEAIAQSFMMDSYTVGIIVREVCQAVYAQFKSKHMAVPSKKDFEKIAEGFERQWNFPNCCGALDGKHVRIKRPAHSGTMFFNYKHFFSIVLQAVADSYYRFLFVDVGAYGKQSDGGIFDASLLSKFIANADNFPADRCPPGGTMKLPYTFLCDDAYPLRRNMMKPFSGANLTPQQDIYNGRLSRARRCVECAFGILVNKWRLLLKSIETNENTADSIVKCAAILHNLIIDREGIDESLLEAVHSLTDSKEVQNSSVETGRRYNRKGSSALAIRDAWNEYFNSSVGSVPWQNRYKKH